MKQNETNIPIVGTETHSTYQNTKSERQCWSIWANQIIIPPLAGGHIFEWKEAACMIIISTS